MHSNASRRLWLGAIAVLGSAATVRVARADPRDAPIAQPPEPSPRSWMERAAGMRQRAQAAGDQPYGAVIVRQGRIVGEAPSAVVSRRDPTAHAEMEAIRDAARRLGQGDLTGCTLYASSRPCAMCEAAAYWAGIDRMIVGADLADAGPPRLARC